MRPHFSVTKPDPSPVLDGAQLRAARRGLSRRRFRAGYAVDQVDAFLARAGIALDEHHRGEQSSLTVAAVLNKNFQTTQFRGGYD